MAVHIICTSMFCFVLFFPIFIIFLTVPAKQSFKHSPSGPLCFSALSLSFFYLCLISHFSPLFFPFCGCAWVHLWKLVRQFVCLLSQIVCRMLKVCKCCFSSSLQDFDRASEATRGGRSSGWYWCSSSYRHKRHLCQSAALQQWQVLFFGMYELPYKQTELTEHGW